jgi:eukaryotic-like serine/threonine-protein kinase
MTDAARWRLVRAVFDEAVQKSAPEQAAFLADRCGDDDALRREVEQLLAAERGEHGVLERLGARLGSLADVLEDEPEPLVEPYRIIGEAGRGGMGVVYRAHDPRLKRDVALKFLPHFAGADGKARARFIEEARAASALDHPGICTIHDIGTSADGRMYIAMAWYGGGTLADRLRDGPLPFEEAVRVTCDVAAALERAHRAGIVHRDIKPANIAFTESGETRVLDFGVAVLEQADDAIVAGTPRYMAPEQLRGERVDRRADIYSLAVVLHEMLTGNLNRERNPADSTEVSTGASADWSGVPSRLVPVLQRALARDPAQRPATAAQFGEQLLRASAGRRRRPQLRLALVLLVVLSATALIARAFVQESNEDVDAASVAVLPFRVSGDPSIGYLRDGMVDLLAATLTGEGGLRAVDPRTVHNAWLRMTGTETDLEPDSARALARRLRAGRVLLGEVVGTPERIVVNTTLLDVGGRTVARAGIQGPAASLTDMVDTLAARLLSLSAGVEPGRVATLTTTSLPALRAYLEGQAFYRRGRYEEAIRQYARALEIDSTFALAGLGIELAGGWIGGVEQTRELGRALASRHQARLSATDRALLAAAIGPDYPRPSSVRRTLAAIEDALRLAPDRVELWYMQADAYLHFGRAIGVEDWEARAAAGFRRAIEMDSTLAQSLHHLILLYARQGQLELMDAAAAAQLAREPAGSTADFIRWIVSAARSPRSTLPIPLDSLAIETLGWIVMIAQDDGFDPQLGVRAARERTRRAGTASERLERNLALHAVALNTGRPVEALSVTQRLREDQPDPQFHLRLRILDALYADGDSAAAAEAAEELQRSIAARATLLDTERMNRCVLDQWRLLHDVDVRPRPPRRARTEGPAAITVCERIAEALHEAKTRRSVGAAVVRLDSLLREGPYDLPLGDGTIEYAHIALARAFELGGDPALAMTAIGRRVYFLGWQAGHGREPARRSAPRTTPGRLAARPPRHPPLPRPPP